METFRQARPIPQEESEAVGWYCIHYEDDDEQEISLQELKTVLLPPKIRSSRPEARDDGDELSAVLIGNLHSGRNAHAHTCTLDLKTPMHQCQTCGQSFKSARALWS